MKLSRWLMLFLLLLPGAVQAQLLAASQLALADGSVFTMQLTNNGVQQMSGDAVNAYMKITGVDGSGNTRSNYINALSYPVGATVTSPISLLAASTLGAVAVYGKFTTVDSAKAAAAQIAGAQLVFTQLQLPTTPPSPAQMQAIVSLAVSYIRLTGGSGLQGDFNPDVVISGLITALNLPAPCP